MQIDRSAPAAARKVVEDLLPDEDERRLVLKFLADAVQLAHQLAPDRWGVTLQKTMVRLNIGRIETVGVFKASVHVVLDGALRPEGIDGISGLDLNPEVRTLYKTVPGSFACDVPSKSIGVALPLLAESNKALIQKATESPRHPGTSGAHSPGVLRYIEEALGLALPDPSFSSVAPPIIGKLYPWDDVQTLWGGSQTFLAKRNGQIICATLDREKNPDAPEVMVVGHKPINAKRGEEFCAQKGPIPLFIKEDIDRWRYNGRYEVRDFSESREVVKQYENEASGPLSRVIFLKAADNQDELSLFPDLDADAEGAGEGRTRMVQHLRRERNRGIVVSKKRQVRALTGRLACEACGFDFTTFYQPYAEDFCEVHHRNLLSGSAGEVTTRLEDLAILCSNCHRVIHLIRPMPSVEAFAAQLAHRRPPQ